MPIVPMKQRVTVVPPASTDKWARTIPGNPVEYRARVSEEINVVKNQLGEEAVSNMALYFDKYPDISYDHAIEYENERGVRIARKPISIEPKRMLNGKPIVTVVYV